MFTAAAPPQDHLQKEVEITTEGPHVFCSSIIPTACLFDLSFVSRCRTVTTNTRVKQKHPSCLRNVGLLKMNKLVNEADFEHFRK
jgi:hypothetical protein